MPNLLLSQPLTSADAQRIGLDIRAYSIGETISVDDFVAQTLIRTGYGIATGSVIDALIIDSGPPSATVGQDGQWYLDSYSEVLWGPKVGGLWPTNPIRPDRGVAHFAIDGNGHLQMTYSTGTTVDLGYIIGPQGAPPPNATTTVAGGIKIAGDLAGTWDAPTVPKLAGKVDTASVGQQGGPAGLSALFGRLLARNGANLVRVGAHFPGYGTGSSGTPTTLATLAQLEADLAVGLDYALLFQSLNPGDVYTAAMWAQAQAFLDAGREVVLNLQLQGSHAQISGGSFDAAIGQLGGYVLAYAAANPHWRDTLIVKILHEGNLTSTYPWCVYAPANLTAAGNSVATSAANYRAAYAYASGKIKTATTDAAGARWARIVWEIGNANNASDPAQFDVFYPGDAYVDMVSINNYNRYGLSSGVSYWGSFGSLIANALEAVRRIAPGKPVMIGETSSAPGGYLNSVTVTAGGTGYAAGTTATVVGAGSGATVTPVISGGVITGMTITAPGQDYNYLTAPTITLANTGGGTGATFTVSVAGSKYSKADWFLDAFRWIKSNTDIGYLTFFFENKFVSATDDRMWAPNTVTERAAWTRGYGLLNGRVRGGDAHLVRQKAGVNLCPDPYGNDVSKWTAAGANVGVLSRTTAVDNLPGDTDPRQQAISNAVAGNNLGVIRLSHAGVVGNTWDNRVYFPLAYNLISPNETVTISFDARAHRTSSATTGQMNLLATLETAGTTPPTIGRGAVPQKLTEQYRRYSIVTSSGDFGASTAGWRVAFCIGTSDMVGELDITNIKVEYGEEPTPLLAPTRQLTRTTVADANYSYGTTGTTDEVLAYTALTAARTVTLPDATKVPAGRTITVKDESGSAGTYGITLTTTAGQTIDGSATKPIITAYGAAQVYSNGVQWFTVQATAAAASGGGGSSSDVGTVTVLGADGSVPFEVDIAGHWGITDAGQVYYDSNGALPAEAGLLVPDPDGNGFSVFRPGGPWTSEDQRVANFIAQRAGGSGAASATSAALDAQYAIYWGSGTSFPTTGVKSGDSYRHTAYGLHFYTAMGWRQRGPHELTAAARAALDTSGIYPGFLVFETDTARTWQWNGAWGVITGGPGLRLAKAGSQAIGANTWVPLTWDTPASVPLLGTGMFSAATATRLTAPVAGRYRVGASSGGANQISLRLNSQGYPGTPTAGQALAALNMGAAGAPAISADEVVLAAGDYVEAYVQATAAGNAGTVSGYLAFFTLSYIGPAW